MNPLQQSIKENVLDPILKERLHMSPGKVIRYNHVQHRADVEVRNPVSAGFRVLYDVPIMIGAGGVHGAALDEGDEVWVTYLGGNSMHPRITAMADQNYAETTRERKMRHTKKGALIPDSIMRW